MSIINFSNTRQMEGLFDAINPIKELIESKINLSFKYAPDGRIV